MSFIYDEFVKHLLKNAQQTPAPAPSSDPAASRGKSLNEFAKEMIANLENQIGQFTADTDNASLRPQNLGSLDALFLFLSENNLKKAGLPIVPSANEFIGLTPSEKSFYSNYPDVDENPKYHVHKALLIEYLKELLAQRNPLLTTLLNQRIQDANSQLDLNFNEGPQNKVDTNNDKASAFYKENDPNSQATNNSKQNAQNKIQALSRVMANLPFDPDDISFKRIMDFFTVYMQVVSLDGSGDQTSTRGQEVGTRILAAQSAMQQAQANTISQTSTFPAKASPEQFKQIVKKPDPDGAHYHGLIDRLMAVIEAARFVVNDLLNAYANNQDNGINRNDVQNQLLIYKQNFNSLSLLDRAK